MGKQRRKFEDGFKAKVAFEATKEEKTLAELSSKYGVHSNLIAKWKVHFLANIGNVFTGNSTNKKQEDEISRDDLLREIGQLKMENEFLKKKYTKLFE